MKQLNWKNAIYYGEAFGFVFAWAIGLVVALSNSQQDSPTQRSDQVVAARPAPLSLD